MSVVHGQKTATYRAITDGGGWRFHFYCDLSGELLCTTRPVRAETEEAALDVAWAAEGRKHFERCERCGRWVSDAMFNADVHECVACTPWESIPHFCRWCGRRLAEPSQFCPICGKLLRYEEEMP